MKQSKDKDKPKQRRKIMIYVSPSPDIEKMEQKHEPRVLEETIHVNCSPQSLTLPKVRLIKNPFENAEKLKPVLNVMNMKEKENSQKKNTKILFHITK